MSRYILRLALGLSLVCGLLAAAPLAGRSDSLTMPSYLLPPEGCPAPCFMGIRPGITSAQEAIALLEAHGWIGHITTTGYEAGTASLTWSGQNLEIMPDGAWATLAIEDNIVRSIAVPTRLALGDILVWYGHVDWWSLNTNEAYAGYQHAGFAARFPLHRRPLRSFRLFYGAPITLHYLATS